MKLIRDKMGRDWEGGGIDSGEEERRDRETRGGTRGEGIKQEDIRGGGKRKGRKFLFVISSCCPHSSLHPLITSS